MILYISRTFPGTDIGEGCVKKKNWKEKKNHMDPSYELLGWRGGPG